MSTSSWLTLVFGLGFTVVVIIITSAIVTVLVNRAAAAKPTTERPQQPGLLRDDERRQVTHVQADRLTSQPPQLVSGLRELEAARAAELSRRRP